MTYLHPLPLEHRLVQEAVRWVTPLRLERRLAPRRLAPRRLVPRALWAARGALWACTPYRLGVLKVDGGGVRVGVRVSYPYPYPYP